MSFHAGLFIGLAAAIVTWLFGYVYGINQRLRERKRCADIAEFECLDIGCTAEEANGVVRRTRNAITLSIMEGKRPRIHMLD